MKAKWNCLFFSPFQMKASSICLKFGKCLCPSVIACGGRLPEGWARWVNDGKPNPSSGYGFWDPCSSIPIDHHMFQKLCLIIFVMILYIIGYFSAFLSLKTNEKFSIKPWYRLKIVGRVIFFKIWIGRHMAFELESMVLFDFKFWLAHMTA